MADPVWNRVLRVWGAFCDGGRTLRDRPVLRDRRCLLLPYHRSKRAVGCLGLRVHRIRNLLLPMCPFGHNASTSKTDPKRRLGANKARIEKSLHSRPRVRNKKELIVSD